MPDATPHAATPHDHAPASPDDEATGPTPVPCGCSAEPEATPTTWRARLARLPQTFVASALVAVLGLGYVVGGPVGAVLLGLALAAFAAVIGVSWSVLSRVERLLRLTVFVFLIGLALVRLLPR